MATITEDYVSFEIARLLKEKGFNESTICKYADVGGITEKWYDDYRERVLRFDWNEGYLIEPPIAPKDQYEIIGDTISAPTLQMAMKWLREEKGIAAVPILRSVLDNEKFLWDIEITVAKTNETYHQGWTYESYERACEAAIKYSLKNLI